ncbi:protein kinase [bacterium]|nr:protein kinase [bacterium]
MKFLACEDARPLLVPLLDEEIDLGERASLDAHLGTCAPCHEERDALRVLTDLLRAHFSSRAEARVTDEVLDALEDESTEPLELPAKPAIAAAPPAAPDVPRERARSDTDPAITPARKRADTEPYGFSASGPGSSSSPEEDPSRLVGAVLGGYRIDSPIASGGMGTVYRATHLALDRPVALKVLSRRLAASDTYLKRFVREARTAATIDHPNIIRVYDAGEDKEETFFAMELVNGEDAETLVIDRKHPFSPRRAVQVALEVARALEAAHRAGVVHRDVKPANILLTPEGAVKLADLGLAKLEETGLLPGDPKLTGRKVLMGSPNYMPPEQAEDARNAEPRSDVFALGATLFHLVTGVRPFGTGTSLEVSGRVVDPAPLEVPDRAADGTPIDPGLRAIIARACEKDLARRYPSASALREDLEAYSKYVEAAQTTTPVPAAPATPRRSGKLPAAKAPSRRITAEQAHTKRGTGRLAHRSSPVTAVVAAIFLLVIVTFLIVPRSREPAQVEPRSDLAPVTSE